MAKKAAPGSGLDPQSVIPELKKFLALEAPWLLPELKNADTTSVQQLEQDLLRIIDERMQADDTELWPFTTAGAAAGWSRKVLSELVAGFFRRQQIKAAITHEERLEMYRAMLLTRHVDDLCKKHFDKKEVKWGTYPSPQKGFRSTGQEAIVGMALPLRRPPKENFDIVAPLIRDLGVTLMFIKDPLHPLLVQFGKKGTPMDGRDLHIGVFEKGVLPATAPLAIATQTLIGIAYAFKMRKEDRVCVSFIGDGGSSLGEWHEAINFAAVQKLGMIFVIENNFWALGTHVSEQTAVRRFALKAVGYGIPGITILGQDPDEIAAASAWAAHRARTGKGPTLIEIVTYRRSGHAHHDDDRFHGQPEQKIAGYEFEEERKAWEALDPIELYEKKWKFPASLRKEVEQEALEAERKAIEAPWPTPEDYRTRVYAPRVEPVPEYKANTTKRMAYDEALRQAIIEMMEQDERVFVLGEDVGGRYGGAFGVTRGLAKRFGTHRCLNTPLAESAIVGCGVGAALMGLRPVVEMQFADFLAPGFNALVNNAAKLYWRWGRPVGMVVRLPYGGATGTMNRLLGGGPYHSQCPEAWFMRTPGWKVVAPSTPTDAKGLMTAAIRDNNPIIYLEAKGLYGFFRNDLREDVPLGSDFEVPFGKALVRREGRHISCITYGAMVWTALEAAEKLSKQGIELEVIDLRSLVPLDEECVLTSIAKTNRALILHEDTRRAGPGAEIAAIISEKAIYHLDAPIVRVTAPDTPVPYSPPLEYDYLPKADDVVRAAIAMME